MAKGLLTLSYGTTYDDTRAVTLDAIEAELARAFPGRERFSAYSSRFVARTLKARGERCETVAEALSLMEAAGVDDAVVAMVYLMDAAESRRVAGEVAAWAAAGPRTVRLAATLLHAPEDRAALAAVLAHEFADVAPDEALLLAGHGAGDGAGNDVYVQLQDELRVRGHANWLVATLEGTPSLDDVLDALSPYARVTVAPLLVVAGDHARNDLAGEGPESWASRLRAAGHEVRCVARGLGEYDGVRRLAVRHAQEAPLLEAGAAGA